MNREGLFQTVRIAMLTLMLSGGVCFADDISFVETVAAIASTNMLETWEGGYAFREAVSPNGATNLCLCLYGKDNVDGSLLEVYERNLSQVRKILPADENVKGVTPVILQFGAFINRESECYWSRWRHPGNGGNASYIIYEITNGFLSVSANYEYCDIGAGKSWHVVDSDGCYTVTNGVPTSDSVVLWTNTNTIYSVVTP